MTVTDPWDMLPVLTRSHGTTTPLVADALKDMADEGWCNRCFQLADDMGCTELTVAQIVLDEYDVDRDRAGSLAEALFTDTPERLAMTLPEPGTYIVTINAAGIPRGFMYANRDDARFDYDYARCRW